MNILESNLAFTQKPEKRTKTNRIILHHAAASSCTVQQIHSWHLANGWAGIGYHYFVKKDGSICRGRAENTVGSHAGNNNLDSIGICFEGNFEKETMPGIQLSSGEKLIADIVSRYESLKIIRHKDVNCTACPGKNFPFEKMVLKPSAAGPAGNACKVIKEGDTGAAVTALQKSLAAKGYVLESDGIFGPKTLAAVKDFQTAFCITADGLVGEETSEALQEATPGDPYCPIPSCNLKKGSKGAGVKWVQKALTVKKYSVGKCGVDGDFGGDTHRAVVQYQKANQLTADGIVGKNTRGKLLV